MMSVAEAAFPYEMQSDPHANRACGAACLSMVYRSFGKEVPQAQIWPAIAKQNHRGSLASTTHLMAEDALGRGLSALVVQARHPLHALRLCHESGVRAILNHRLNRSAPAGHFSVLINIDDKSVLLHDPFLGPSRRLSQAELLELWQPRLPNSEIVGNVLIGVAAEPPALPACQLCRTPIPSEVECPKCKNPVSLQPAVLLGCISNACIARMWEYICCPSCDYLWDFTHQPQPVEASAAGPGVSGRPSPSPPVAASPTPSLDINKLFGEIDKFCAYILGIPAAANHPEIRKQLEFIACSKKKFALAHAELVASRAMRQGEFAALAKTAKEQEAAHRKKMEELNTPSQRLDGNALGHALLKNLGFRS
jgi:Peptidase C39 family